MRSSDPVREALPVPGGERQETLPDARRDLKHGRYSREVLEFRQTMRELLRDSAEKLELV